MALSTRNISTTINRAMYTSRIRFCRYIGFSVRVGPKSANAERLARYELTWALMGDSLFKL